VVGGLGGEKGLTPHLDGLIREADWAGPAVSSSSWVAPALASLWTGLRPWQHQVLHMGQANLPADVPTLPAALRTAGYRTEGFADGFWAKPRFGYGRGFDHYRGLARGWVARERLAGLGAANAGDHR
jgi:arylsulfatase A-like enzyme